MDIDFSKGTAGASATFPMQCSALRKGGMVMIKGHPCKISEMSTSKTGKHGHAKVHLVGYDIITNKKYEDICPSTHNMEVPVVSKKDYQIIDRDPDNFLTLMDDSGDTKADLKVVDDVGEQIQVKLDNDEAITVSVMTVLGKEYVIWKPLQ
ncbi:eukaryotic translation initiation factor 5A-1-like [Nelusetta ayraudi]|uniref:eukaryotic translation initiation factor 5A-1-like n=1 Tax=Nelusetta ayraudi TaxID=303726 RepID=UPI003F6F364A